MRTMWNEKKTKRIDVETKQNVKLLLAVTVDHLSCSSTIHP